MRLVEMQERPNYGRILVMLSVKSQSVRETDNSAYIKTKRPGPIWLPGGFQLMRRVATESNHYRRWLVDVVLLPVQGSVGLDDDVFVRGLLEFVDEHGFARLQRLRDFGMDAQRQVWIFVIRGGHLSRFGLDFVAKGRARLHHAAAGAIRAGLAEHALERLLGAFARDADEAEFVERQRL